MPLIQARAISDRPFWRAGLYLPPAITEHEVTAEQLAELQADPRVFVQVVEEPAPPAGDPPQDPPNDPPAPPAGDPPAKGKAKE